MIRLFHVSEEPDIAEFEPRPVGSWDPRVSGLAVWAIDEAHLPNYLLPRDCPRVTHTCDTQTTLADRERFFGVSRAARIVAIEPAWLDSALHSPIRLYEMPTMDLRIARRARGAFHRKGARRSHLRAPDRSAVVGNADARCRVADREGPTGAAQDGRELKPQLFKYAAHERQHTALNIPAMQRALGRDLTNPAADELPQLSRSGYFVSFPLHPSSASNWYSGKVSLCNQSIPGRDAMWKRNSHPGSRDIKHIHRKPRRDDSMVAIVLG